MCGGYAIRETNAAETFANFVTSNREWITPFLGLLLGFVIASILMSSAAKRISRRA
jgi:hypothetical protein